MKYYFVRSELALKFRVKINVWVQRTWDEGGADPGHALINRENKIYDLNY